MYYVRIVWVMKCRVVWNLCNLCFGDGVGYLIEVFLLIFDDDDVFVVGYLVVVNVFVVFSDY